MEGRRISPQEGPFKCPAAVYGGDSYGEVYGGDSRLVPFVENVIPSTVNTVPHITQQWRVLCKGTPVRQDCLLSAVHLFICLPVANLQQLIITQIIII